MQILFNSSGSRCNNLPSILLCSCRSQLSGAAAKHSTFPRSSVSTEPTHCTVGAAAAVTSTQAQSVSLDQDSTLELVTYPHRKCLLAPVQDSCPTSHPIQRREHRQNCPTTATTTTITNSLTRQTSHNSYSHRSTTLSRFLLLPRTRHLNPPRNSESSTDGFAPSRPRPFSRYPAQRFSQAPTLELIFSCQNRTQETVSPTTPLSCDDSDQPHTEESQT